MSQQVPTLFFFPVFNTVFWSCSLCSPCFIVLLTPKEELLGL